MATSSDTALGKRKRGEPGDDEQKALSSTYADYFTSNKTVNIYVGPERKLYILNEDLLCDKVPFFRAAFKSGFKEGLEKQMDMPEDDIEAFGCFIEWLYRFQLPDNTRHYFKTDTQSAEEIMWCKTWILADKLDLKDLVDLVYLRFQKYRGDASSSPLSEETVKFVWDTMPESAPHRLFLIDKSTEEAFFTPKDRADWLCSPAITHQEYCHAVMKSTASHIHLEDPAACSFKLCKLHDKTDKYLSRQSLFSLWSRSAYFARKIGGQNPGKPSYESDSDDSDY